MLYRDVVGGGRFGSVGTLLAGELNLPAGVSVGGDGTVWVADTRNNRIQSYDPLSGVWTVFVNASGLSGFKLPWGVTVAPDGSIWVADSGRDRIVKMLPDGAIYVSDIWNNRIIKMSELAGV